ncbi:hypothetical protein PP568_06715 [Mycobacteroides abscessus]|nr:hypothetical protein [Mycobacteroides abscessus]MBN7463877.1 hypothetical protein [Mycobacteroides abscessus subsp. abscessus]MBN7555230.1 hypothetical protein [Mycobacteroides abscessus subsp. abscessus]MDM2404622.1 hypothetical protein [Mycobacteroides abscessus]MDM2414340.1 hypothetical protein [Mycobacteroides abscessus]MDO3011895.1 hypothetical protein [Mycobacteroides abscessus subsp. abscessus]
MNASATLTRTQFFAPAADATAIAAVIAAITETEPVVRRMTRSDGAETERFGFESGGVALEITAHYRTFVPALIEFRVPDAPALAAAMERVRAAGFDPEPWPADEPVHAVVHVAGTEINVQRNA